MAVSGRSGPSEFGVRTVVTEGERGGSADRPTHPPAPDGHDPSERPTD